MELAQTKISNTLKSKVDELFRLSSAVGQINGLADEHVSIALQPMELDTWHYRVAFVAAVNVDDADGIYVFVEDADGCRDCEAFDVEVRVDSRIMRINGATGVVYVGLDKVNQCDVLIGNGTSDVARDLSMLRADVNKGAIVVGFVKSSITLRNAIVDELVDTLWVPRFHKIFEDYARDCELGTIISPQVSLVYKVREYVAQAYEGGIIAIDVVTRIPFVVNKAEN